MAVQQQNPMLHRLSEAGTKGRPGRMGDTGKRAPSALGGQIIQLQVTLVNIECPSNAKRYSKCIGNASLGLLNGRFTQGAFLLSNGQETGVQGQWADKDWETRSSL